MLPNKHASIYQFFHAEASAEIALWRAVVLQALLDLAQKGILSRTKGEKPEIARRQAEAWWFEAAHTKDREQVFALAVLDPARLVRTARLIQQGDRQARGHVAQLSRMVAMRNPTSILTDIAFNEN